MIQTELPDRRPPSCLYAEYEATPGRQLAELSIKAEAPFQTRTSTQNELNELLRHFYVKGHNGNLTRSDAETRVVVECRGKATAARG